MKVLFHAYNTCCQNTSGGVQVRIRRMKNLLTERGLQVDFFNPYETNIRDYDVLHIFMLNPETAGLIAAAKSAGVKVVLSSIVGLNKPQWWRKWIGMRAPVQTDYKQKQNIIDLSDAIIAETPAEADFIHQEYRKPICQIYVIPNGMDEIGPGTDEIYEMIERNRRYALQVGRFDENKNQLNVIRALRGADYDVVFIGGTGLNGPAHYYDSCLKAAKGYDNIHLLGWIESNTPLLNSAFHNAHAVLLPSHHETFGLVATEGAAAGAHVCISNTLAINGFNVFKKEHTYNPDDIREIRQIIDHVMATPKDNALKERAKEVFNWEKIVSEHINIYNAL